jgi:hypothetical protein
MDEETLTELEALGKRLNHLLLIIIRHEKEIYDIHEILIRAGLEHAKERIPGGLDTQKQATDRPVPKTG